MKDIIFPVLEDLYDKLNGLLTDIPVYSVIPDDQDQPYIHIGDVINTQVECKDHFRTMGTFNINYSTGYNVYGSISQHYKNIGSIKGALKPETNSVLDLGSSFNMIYLRLETDNGLEINNLEKRIYTTTIQYVYEIIEV